QFVLGFEGADGFKLLRGEAEEVAQLADGSNGVLGLPAPVVPQVVWDVLPERMARRAWRFIVATFRGGRNRALNFRNAHQVASYSGTSHASPAVERCPPGIGVLVWF